MKRVTYLLLLTTIFCALGCSAAGAETVLPKVFLASGPTNELIAESGTAKTKFIGIVNLAGIGYRFTLSQAAAMATSGEVLLWLLGVELSGKKCKSPSDAAGNVLVPGEWHAVLALGGGTKLFIILFSVTPALSIECEGTTIKVSGSEGFDVEPYGVATKELTASAGEKCPYNVYINDSNEMITGGLKSETGGLKAATCQEVEGTQKYKSEVELEVATERAKTTLPEAFLESGTANQLAAESATAKTKFAGIVSLAGVGYRFTLSQAAAMTSLGVASFWLLGVELSGKKCKSPSDTAGNVLVPGEWHLVLALSGGTKLFIILFVITPTLMIECEGTTVGVSGSEGFNAEPYGVETEELTAITGAKCPYNVYNNDSNEMITGGLKSETGGLKSATCQEVEGTQKYKSEVGLEVATTPAEKSTILPTILLVSGASNNLVAENAAAKTKFAGIVNLAGVGYRFTLSQAAAMTSLGVASFWLLGVELSGKKCKSPSDAAGSVLVTGEWHTVRTLGGGAKLFIVLLLVTPAGAIECEGTTINVSGSEGFSVETYGTATKELTATAGEKCPYNSYNNDSDEMITGGLKSETGGLKSATCQEVEGTQKYKSEVELEVMKP